jgi:phage shock protein A
MWKSIFNRFNNLFKAKAITALDQLENPVQMYELAVHESEQNLQNMTKALAVALGDQKTKEREYQQALLETESWQHKAKIALAQGQEDLARTALEHKGIAVRKAEEYGAINQMLKTKIEDQKKQLARMKIKHEELKAKKSVFAAKYETAKAQKQMAESVGGLNTTALSQVSKLEEKINKLEAESDALMELTEGSAHSVEVQLLEATTAYQVQEDLETLQLQLNTEQKEKEQKKMKMIEEQLSKNENEKKKLLNEFYSDKTQKQKPADDKGDIMKNFFNK